MALPSWGRAQSHTGIPRPCWAMHQARGSAHQVSAAGRAHVLQRDPAGSSVTGCRSQPEGSNTVPVLGELSGSRQTQTETRSYHGELSDGHRSPGQAQGVPEAAGSWGRGRARLRSFPEPGAREPGGTEEPGHPGQSTGRPDDENGVAAAGAALRDGRARHAA